MKYLNFKPKNFYDFYLLMSAVRGPDYLEDWTLKGVFTLFIRTAVFKNRDFNFTAPTEHVIKELIYTVEKAEKSDFFITHYLSHIEQALEVLEKYVKNKKLIRDYIELVRNVMALVIAIRSNNEDAIKEAIDDIKFTTKRICEGLGVDFNGGEIDITWEELQRTLKKKVEE